MFLVGSSSSLLPPLSVSHQGLLAIACQSLLSLSYSYCCICSLSPYHFMPELFPSQNSFLTCLRTSSCFPVQFIWHPVVRLIFFKHCFHHFSQLKCVQRTLLQTDELLMIFPECLTHFYLEKFCQGYGFLLKYFSASLNSLHPAGLSSSPSLHESSLTINSNLSGLEFLWHIIPILFTFLCSSLCKSYFPICVAAFLKLRQWASLQACGAYAVEKEPGSDQITTAIISCCHSHLQLKISYASFMICLLLLGYPCWPTSQQRLVLGAKITAFLIHISILSHCSSKILLASSGESSTLATHSVEISSPLGTSRKPSFQPLSEPRYLLSPFGRHLVLFVNQSISSPEITFSYQGLFQSRILLATVNFLIIIPSTQQEIPIHSTFTQLIE